MRLCRKCGTMGRRRCGSPPPNCRSWRSIWTIAAPRQDRRRPLLRARAKTGTRRNLEQVYSSPERQTGRAAAGAGRGGLPPQDRDGQLSAATAACARSERGRQRAKGNRGGEGNNGSECACGDNGQFATGAAGKADIG